MTTRRAQSFTPDPTAMRARANDHASFREPRAASIRVAVLGGPPGAAAADRVR